VGRVPTFCHGLIQYGVCSSLNDEIAAAIMSIGQHRIIPMRVSKLSQIVILGECDSARPGTHGDVARWVPDRFASGKTDLGSIDLLQDARRQRNGAVKYALRSTDPSTVMALFN
jgi:hypothetical protein